jgi:hypothetical protein
MTHTLLQSQLNGELVSLELYYPWNTVWVGNPQTRIFVFIVTLLSPKYTCNPNQSWCLFFLVGVESLTGVE